MICEYAVRIFYANYVLVRKGGDLFTDVVNTYTNNDTFITLE